MRERLVLPIRYVVRRSLPAVLILLSALLSSSSLPAQDAALRGVVTDATGAMLRNATVILLDRVAGKIATTATANDGSFSFRAVPPGQYTLLIECFGFQQKNVSILVPLSADKPLQIDLRASSLGTTITVTAESSNFRTTNASSATKVTIPIEEIPQGIGVAGQSLIQSQQDTHFADAAENISGVYRDVLAAGDIGDALTIRGLPLNVFSSYFEDGFLFDGMVPTDSTDVESIEVLKGPPSVLYGRAASGGMVNLITKEPLPARTTHLSMQSDSFGSVRPTFDVTGPLATDDKLLYRLNGEYASEANFRNFFHDRRYFVAPQLRWSPDTSTSVRLQFQYMHDRTTTDYGIPGLGDRPAPVSISNFYGEPWQYSLLQKKIGTVDASKGLGNNWSVRTGFRSAATNWDYLDTSTAHLLSDDNTVARFSEDGAFPLRSYDSQTDLTGLFRTGQLDHSVLIGFEYGQEQVVQNAVFGDAPSINLYHPIPFSQVRPDEATLAEYFFNPADPDYFMLDATTKLISHGGYFQDHVTLLPALKALIGARIEAFTQRYDETNSGNHVAQENTAFLPRIGLTYQPKEPVVFYVSWSRSFSPTLAAQIAPGGKPFPSEYGQQYEGGARTSELNGKLSTTLAVYHIRSNNLLVTNPANPLTSIEIGKAISKGVEFETSGRILPGWDMTFAYAYNEARIAGDATYRVGNTFQNAPRHGGSLWTVYELQHGILAGLEFGGGVSARTYRFVDPSNELELPGYGRIDATVRYRFGPVRHQEKMFQLGVNIENLTDRSYFQSGNTPNVIFPGSPINALSRFDVRF